MSKKVVGVDAYLAQFKVDVAANQEHNKQIAEETRQRLDDMKEAIDKNAVNFAEVKLLLKAFQPPTTTAIPPPPTCGFSAQTSPGLATQPMLTGSYTVYAPPTSRTVFPTAPLVNPTAPPSTTYTSFLRLYFDSQGFPIPPWETYNNYHQRPPFAPGHKCPEKSLQVMVIYDREIDEEEEEHEPAMEEKNSVGDG
ncbi:hypothetical protein Tco_1486649 [Tanacetum coccineum]